MNRIGLVSEWCHVVAVRTDRRRTTGGRSDSVAVNTLPGSVERIEVRRILGLRCGTLAGSLFVLFGETETGWNTGFSGRQRHFMPILLNAAFHTTLPKLEDLASVGEGEEVLVVGDELDDAGHGYFPWL